MDPTPVVALEYAVADDPAGRRLARRVGWLLIVVGCADAVAGLLGTPFGLGGRQLFVYGSVGLLFLALASFGCCLMVVSGIGLATGRRRAPLSLDVLLVYSVLYLIAVVGARSVMLLSGGTRSLFDWAVASVAGLFPAVHWLAVPVLAWCAVRGRGGVDSTRGSRD